MSITRNTFGLALTLALLAQFAFLGPAAFAAEPAPATGLRQIVLAGGCFWGMELVFDNVAGVKQALPGYSGGDAYLHYDLVSTGTTRHAESVRITYDPSEVSLDQLLTVYFTVAHDPNATQSSNPGRRPAIPLGHLRCERRAACCCKSDNRKADCRTPLLLADRNDARTVAPLLSG